MTGYKTNILLSLLFSYSSIRDFEVQVDWEFQEGSQQESKMCFQDWEDRLNPAFQKAGLGCLFWSPLGTLVSSSSFVNDFHD